MYVHTMCMHACMVRYDCGLGDGLRSTTVRYGIRCDGFSRRLPENPGGIQSDCGAYDLRETWVRNEPDAEDAFEKIQGPADDDTLPADKGDWLEWLEHRGWPEWLIGQPELIDPRARKCWATLPTLCRLQKLREYVDHILLKLDMALELAVSSFDMCAGFSSRGGGPGRPGARFSCALYFQELLLQNNAIHDALVSRFGNDEDWDEQVISSYIERFLVAAFRSYVSLTFLRRSAVSHEFPYQFSGILPSAALP